MRPTCELNSLHLAYGKLIFCKPEANTGHYLQAHQIPFVFTQKTYKFWLAAYSMQTVRRQCSTCLQTMQHMFADSAAHVRKQCSTCSQSHTHICTFGLRMICQLFGSHVRVPGLTLYHFMQLSRLSAMWMFTCLSTHILNHCLTLVCNIPLMRWQNTVLSHRYYVVTVTVYPFTLVPKDVMLHVCTHLNPPVTIQI